MKYLFIISTLALGAIVGYWVYQDRNNSLISDQPQIIFDNLPPLYCPENAEVIITTSDSAVAVLDQSVPITSCQIMELESILPTAPAEYQISLKVPKAIAVSFQVSLPLQSSVKVPIQLGDVNNDNIIDGSDEKTLTDSLFLDNSNDLDADGKVSIDDILLVRLNQAIGVNRPDGRSWQQ
jgi:hypothetical protein